MRRSASALLIIAGALCATVLLMPGVVGAQVVPEVDGAVQVTSDLSETRGHATPVMAVHPESPGVLAVIEGDAYANRCTVHVSTNAGLSWVSRSPMDLPAPWSGCMFSTTGVIADLAFGQDGTLYAALSGFDPKTYHQRIFLARSSDLGERWELTELPWIEGNIPEGQSGGDALPSVVVDPSDPNRIHVAWWSNNGAWNLSEAITKGKRWCNDFVPRPWVATSTDAGQTFSPPVDMAGDTPGCMTEPYLEVGNDGELFAFFGEATRGEDEGGTGAPSHLYVSVSRDGGETFTVSPIHEQDTEDGGDGDWLSAPSPGIDRRSSTLYVAWEDLGGEVPSIRFMRSADGGATWSQPISLNDEAPKRTWGFSEQFPSLNVAPNGRIDVAWYDWRNDVTFTEDAEENNLQDVYSTYSTDGGRTWSDNLRVNDRVIDRRFGARKVGFITGPVGLASTDDATYVAWDDTRNGNERTGTQDVYATRIRFTAPGDLFTPPGRPPLFWTAIGAAAALCVGGLVLLAGTAMARR